jgi:hypothetical protein
LEKLETILRGKLLSLKAFIIMKRKMRKISIMNQFQFKVIKGSLDIQEDLLNMVMKVIISLEELHLVIKHISLLNQRDRQMES